MASQRVLSTVRPQRTAFLIPSGEPEWKLCCLHLLDYCSRIWGGYGALFIPTDGTTISSEFWSLLEKFEPDHIALYRRSGRDLEEDESDRFNSLVEKHLEKWEADTGERLPYQVEAIRSNIRAWPTQPFALTESLEAELKRRLNPFHFEERVVNRFVDAGSSPEYPETSLIDVLGIARDCPPEVTILRSEGTDHNLWLGANVGYARPETIDNLRALVKATISDQPVSDHFTPALTAVPGIYNRGGPTYLSGLSMVGLDLYAAGRASALSFPTLVVVGSSLKDFCFYQCLSRMRQRVVWLPPWCGESATPSSEGLRDEFYFVAALRHLTLHSSHHSSAVEVVSLTLDKAGLQESIKRVERAALQETNWRVGSVDQALEFAPMRLYEANNSHYPTVVHVNEDSVIELFVPRQPKSLERVPPQKGRWISELSFPGFQIARHPSIAEWMTGSLTNEARSTRNALALLNVKFLVFGSDDAETAGIRPTIRLPSAEDTFRVVGASAGLSTGPSDKGVYSKALLGKLGGLRKASAFLGSSIGRRLIGIYQARDEAGPGFFLADDRRRYLDFEAFTEICGDDTRARSLIDDFSRDAILYRGFILKCEYCRRTAWYPVSEMSDSFQCKRCHRVQIYSSSHWKGIGQPTWYHQLDEIIFQAFVNDCDIPILAMAFLDGERNGEFSFTDELEFRKSGDKDIWCESDINCVVEGRITIGEAKRSDRLAGTAKEERKLAQRYAELAGTLGAEVVIFATAHERWRDATLELIRESFEARDIPFKAIGSQELFRD